MPSVSRASSRVTIRLTALRSRCSRPVTRRKGSFVKIFASQFATGGWVYGGDRYTAPNRLWDYDTSFNKVENLPPFTPNVAQVRSSGWWD